MEHLRTPTKSANNVAKRRARTPSLKALENIASATEDEEETAAPPPQKEDKTRRRSSRRITTPKRFENDFVSPDTMKGRRKRSAQARSAEDEKTTTETEVEHSEFEELATASKPCPIDVEMLQAEEVVAGKSLYGFNTPKKRGGMALAAMNTPKTPRTPKTPARTLETNTPRSSRQQRPARTSDIKRLPKALTSEPKTPARMRSRLKNEIAKLVEDLSGSDFSADGSDFEPSDSDSLTSSDDDESPDDAVDDEPKTPLRGRRPILVPVLPKTPSALRQRQAARHTKSVDYVPESDGYFQSHGNTKILTSDHTLDRLKNPRLPADRLFSLLAQMTLSTEHENCISSLATEYRTYFPKWLYILNEGFNILLFGLGSKRQLLQSFHREVLAQQTVLVINGFFPSLMLKEILDSITAEILDAGPSPANPHEAVDMIEEEFALIPDTHLYLIVHNLDGAMLRNGRAQAILSRLAKVPNIHLLASIDHINTPLLWDQTKLSNYNFSWWDCTTLLPYTDETAFENSLLVQNSGELALSSMRSVFSSLTANSRGIYMLIVKYQLKSKGNPNYQGMSFKDLYWGCREAFLVSSDLALRAQLTEFLDHKMVKSRRNIDGSEQLTIPIDSLLLQQFLDEQDKK